jgi:hypothetical protein
MVVDYVSAFESTMRPAPRDTHRVNERDSTSAYSGCQDEVFRLHSLNLSTCARLAEGVIWPFSNDSVYLVTEIIAGCAFAPASVIK